MTPQQAINKLQEKNILLTQKNDELITLAENFAQAKRDYSVALATMTLALKEEKHPATLITILAQGEKEVAELRFKKDLAKGLQDACKSAIRGILAAIDSLRSILAYEKEERFNRNV